MNTKAKTKKRVRRHAKVRARVSGTVAIPRLAVFRSNKFIYAQLIDDEKGETLVSASDVKDVKGTKVERAKRVGEKLAEEAGKKKITSAVFDRGGFAYTGRVAAVAEGARSKGLKF